MNQITNTPELIKQSELRILDFKNTISRIKEQMDSIRRTVACEVAAETVDGSKKAFSNAEARETETDKRLQHNEKYQALKSELSVKETQKAQEEIGLQNIKDTFSANRYKVRLCTADKMEKASNNFLGGMQILAGLDKLVNQIMGANNIHHHFNNESGFEIPDDCPF
ncbi:hypothetical protein [Bacteroides sp.]|uniref:hypothetical protein n=1 Tax=Bacteroides sp. TaxID=29523 RepID=UPI00260A57C1|nr:hypothetical protein [Bacteroides sp.]MDD3040443.1 hypothetical protein [Bacteroides sp.]